MNEINSFTFYKNYYELLDNLPKEDKYIMLEAIVDYVFKDKEPILDGLNKAIWNNLKMPIDTSKNNSLRSIGKGAPKGNKNAEKNKPKTNQKQTKNKPKTNRKGNRKQTNNISTFLFLISNFNYLDKGLLREKIEEWLTYKEERNEIYKETGLKSLLKQIENNCRTYGEEAVIELIDECMAKNWKGIIWEKLKDREKLPDWWDKTNKDFKEELTDEERRELEAIKNGTYRA
ncbi:MAG: hypothetical protein IJL74_04765 [Bacilli bacterium]|nr:hypothetical protein [Bacilli bacterium]